MTLPQSNALEWLSAHIHMLGWSGISALTFRLLWMSFKGTVFAVQTKERIIKAEAHLTKMATNCMPTIQKNTEQTNAVLEKQTELLENMDKNIAILVDRSR